MALDRAGFRNVGEFYSPHYLDEVLEGDLQGLRKRWEAIEQDGGARSPARRLWSLASTFFDAVARANDAHDRVTRYEAARQFHAELLDALGYAYAPAALPLEGGTVVPALVAEDRDGKPWLWILDAPFPAAEDDDALDERPFPEQLPSSAAGAPLPDATYRELLDGELFAMDNAPRWVLFLAGNEAILADRLKWPQGKHLRFALGELYGRRQPAAFEALACLLHRDALNPNADACLLDTLDEHSHRHAHAVTTDLKRGARKAVELLANEAVHHLRMVSKQEVFGKDAAQGEQLAAELTGECLTYLYRLLFLFFVEAQGSEMGVVATGSASYREGYSLESLRDLELVALTTDEARNGHYLHHSLEKLFRLVHEGFPNVKAARSSLDGFEMAGLRSPLFDAARTPLLRQVKLRNSVLQRVIELLSLSEEGKKKGKSGRGRISYANLGINQLGSVYEGLLSYTGFFAREDLFEVQAAGEASEDGEASEARVYFVPRGDLGKYKKDEIVCAEGGKPVCHPKGTFVFRLAGRDREKSASYYTPEVLTKCLTKYTLKERVEGLSADEILSLTVCEPAMGSGAFLTEAIGQLADAYLERKQKERGETLPSAAYALERQRVKTHLALNNVYGVDLKPGALELAKVSLTLATLHPGGKAPYFGLGLAAGNSLVGARREVFSADMLINSGSPGTDKAPERIPLGTPRPTGSVYHFLVGDRAMAPFDADKVARELEPKGTATISAWRKDFVAPWSKAELKTLERLSAKVDLLWSEHAAARKELRRGLAQPVAVWGQEGASAAALGDERWKTVEECEERAAVMESGTRAGRRLAAVMDAWCALWFWPLQRAQSLPTRDEWLVEVEGLLEGDVDALLEAEGGASERRRIVSELTGLYSFHHWEVAFAEVFDQRGGFDVILGNPPWVKVEWNEQGILSDFEPLVDVRKWSASAVANKRTELLDGRDRLDRYIAAFEEMIDTGAYFSALQNYPTLRGVKSNLYKCFQIRSWGLIANGGFVGLLYQPGILDDPNGGALRRALIPRLRLVCRFKNELQLFPGVDHQRPYLFAVSGDSRAPASFLLLSNLFHPRTIDVCLAHDGRGPVPGIKTEDGHWDLRGHRARIVEVNENTLALFARLYDEEGTPALEACLPVVHSREILTVLEKFAAAPRKLAALEGELFATQHFNETIQQKDGTIRRETVRAKKPEDWVVSGPHFYVATPFNKTPNEGCRHNQDYSTVDFVDMPDDYLPRTNYVPACSKSEYRARTPTVPWDSRPVTEYFRHVHREMVATTGERTLAPCLLPPGPAHIHTCFSITFRAVRELAQFNALASSIVVDFFVKSTGMGHVNINLSRRLPVVQKFAPTASPLIARTLRLNCLTAHYAPLWDELYTSHFRKDGWAKGDPRLLTWKALTPTWSRDCAVRTAYARHQALVELDALAALTLGLTADELCLLYRVQFPVLQQYERETFYDQMGRIVFTVNKGLTGVGLARKEWEQIKNARAGDKLPAFAKAYVAPFDRCDRDEDMRAAYKVFADRLDLSAPAPAKSGSRLKSAPPSNRANSAPPGVGASNSTRPGIVSAPRTGVAKTATQRRGHR